MENIEKDVIILANGEIPSHEIPIRLLKETNKIICCDGAVDKLNLLGFEPSVIIGDCDSISQKNRIHYKNIIHQDLDTEYNDLNKAFRYCLDHNYKRVKVLGGLGLREDHALSNLGVMMMFAEKDKIDVEMVTNSGVFTPAFNTITLSSYPGQAISIFSFNQSKLTFHRLKYPVNKRAFSYLWEGGSNEALSDSFSIEFEDGKVLIYRGF